MQGLIFDIEGNDLYPQVSTVHCAWTYNTETKEYTGYEPTRIRKLVTDLNAADFICGHNILGYDTPTLEKIFDTEITVPQYDTLVTARLYYPDIVGGHSLKAWGKRLQVLKGTVTEEEPEDTEDVWATFTPEMYEYCKQDVTVTLALFNHLKKHGFLPELLMEDTGL